MVPLETLKRIAFLRDCGSAHLEKIASFAHSEEFPADVVLFREGQSSPSVYLVIEGNISLQIHDPGHGAHTLQTIGPGELLGWSAVVSAKEMTATARTLSPTQLIVLPASQLREFLNNDTIFGVEFLRRTIRAVGDRLDATHLQLLDLYKDPS